MGSSWEGTTMAALDLVRLRGKDSVCCPTLELWKNDARGSVSETQSVVSARRAEETRLQRASLLPVRPLGFLVGQDQVAGLAHFVELVSVVLQSHFVVRALPAHHLQKEEPSLAVCARVELSSDRLVATHEAAGPAVVSSSGQGVERLLALHADRDLVVPDPARGPAAEFLRLEKI